MRKLILSFAVLCLGLVACAGTAAPPAIETKPEKIGNLTIEAPVGWEKSTDDSYDNWTVYTYSDYEGDDLNASMSIYVDKALQTEISISDFDYKFEDSHDGIDIEFSSVKDTFLGDKPIRIGKGTWQTNYNGTTSDLYDYMRVAMYDADLRGIDVQYVYKDSLADKGYADYADKLLDTMQLIYDYQYTTAG